MSICYLHLGMPKTGSTAIQHSFRHYEDDALLYAETGTPQHELIFKLCFSKAALKTTNLRVRLGQDRNFDALAEKARRDIDAAAASGKNVIFSGEAIPGQLRPDEMAAMFAYLRARFERVVVVAYVRPAASLVASQFQQQVKQGRREFSLPSPRYRTFFEPIVANVAPEDLHLIRFHRDDLIDGDIVADFASRVGAARVPEQAVEENESLSAEGVGAMLAFNRFSGPFFDLTQRRQLQKQLRNALASQGVRKFGFSKELVDSYLAEHADDITWMEGVTGFDVRGEFRPVPEPVGSEAELIALGAKLADSVKSDVGSVPAKRSGKKGGAARKSGAGKANAGVGSGKRAGASAAGPKGRRKRRGGNGEDMVGQNALASGRKQGAGKRQGAGKGKGGGKGARNAQTAEGAVDTEL
ncbi:hypothetical protein LCM17_06640 [Cereibacter sphaeroides]|nr:hypothetical protein [Cereibacter sphaeroides]